MPPEPEPKSPEEPNTVAEPEEPANREDRRAPLILEHIFDYTFKRTRK